MKWCQSVVMFAVCLGLLAGCGHKSSPQAPPISSVGPPSVIEDSPELEEEVSPLKQPNRIAEIHDEIYTDAQVHFDEQEFSQTVNGLRRLLALRPKKELEGQGRWLLAQTFFQLGEWEAAGEQYERLVTATPQLGYADDAKRRLREIQKLLESSRLPPKETQAIRLSLAQLPSTDGFDEGIKKMREDGVTTLLIDLGCPPVPSLGKKKVFTDSRLSLGSVQQSIHSFSARSHRQQLQVFVGMDPRCLGDWSTSLIPEWRDQSFNMKTQTSHTNKFYDVFHPKYQDYLLKFLFQLAQQGIDGVVFFDDHPLGIYDGMTSSALSKFKKQFGEPFNPLSVFNKKGNTEGYLQSTKSRQKIVENSVFWRWVGWKARERLTTFERLMAEIRKVHPKLQFGLEIHPHGLTDPVRALVNYSQDAMEATQRPFSFFFVRPEIDRQSTYDQQTVLEKLRRISTKAVLGRLLPAVDDPRRVWVSVPSDGERRIVPGNDFQDSSLFQGFPSGIGVVHDLRAFS